jgi:hypothetical protein
MMSRPSISVFIISMDIHGCCCFLKVFLDPNLEKPEQNTFYLWPQKTQNTTEVKNLFL